MEDVIGDNDGNWNLGEHMRLVSVYVDDRADEYSCFIGNDDVGAYACLHFENKLAALPPFPLEDALDQSRTIPLGFQEQSDWQAYEWEDELGYDNEVTISADLYPSDFITFFNRKLIRNQPFYPHVPVATESTEVAIPKFKRKQIIPVTPEELNSRASGYSRVYISLFGYIKEPAVASPDQFFSNTLTKVRFHDDSLKDIRKSFQPGEWTRITMKNGFVADVSSIFDSDLPFDTS
jgi:hypothetical protein